MTTRSETVIVALDGAGRLPIDTSGEMKLPGVNVVSIPSDGLALDTLGLRPDIWVIEVEDPKGTYGIDGVVLED